LEFHCTFGQWLWRWWRRRTLRQKAVMVLAACLLLALIRNVLMPVGQLLPVATVKPGAGNTEVIPSRSAVRHHRHAARKIGPPPA
jgi:hypothetical protein